MTTLALPQDLEAERIILGRMMESSSAAEECLATLTVNDFSDVRHGEIFSCMQKIEGVVDLETVFHLLRGHKSIDLQFLAGLAISSGTNVDSVEFFIRSLIRASRLRKLCRVGQDLVMVTTGLQMSPEAIQNDVMRRIDGIFTDLTSDFITPDFALRENFRESGKEVSDYLLYQKMALERGGSTLRGYQTGYSRLDNLISGFCKGNYIIVGARPGVGKSTFAINLILNLLLQNIKVGFFSLEMTAEEVCFKLSTAYAKVSSRDLERGEFYQEDFIKHKECVEEICKLPLYIDESSFLKVNQLIFKAKRMIQTYQIDVLFIDYLGEVKGEGKFSTKQEEIQSVSKALRGLAKDTGVPIICICQLNRQAEEDVRPLKSHLRESGQIEADAHTIILLQKIVPEYTSPQREQILKAYIVKNRFGSEGIIDYTFDTESGYITELGNFR